MSTDSRTVIRLEDVHKRYRLGVVNSRMLTEEVAAWWSRMRGKDDPRRSIEDVRNEQRKGSYFWSLRGVSFTVDQGEVLGVVGRNGAGKSTLLKLMSRISSPTKGRISMRGRVASLLEVGTGFHPELTGRENIFLNGAIMGLRRNEIRGKLDEIIAFSGIDHHIDTPIKRYSSGMKVRLGFAVAAHLEPEILIVDEVLAVGDAEFRRKSVGRMREVANSGRTVLFVSHNMSAVQHLCTKAIWMDAGKVRLTGETSQVISAYMADNTGQGSARTWDETAAPGEADLKLLGIEAVSLHEEKGFWVHEPVEVRMDFVNLGVVDDTIDVRLQLYTDTDILSFIAVMGEVNGPGSWPLGRVRVTCTIPAHLLNASGYRIELVIMRNGAHWIHVPETVTFEMQEGPRISNWYKNWPGTLRPRLSWELAAHEH